MLSYKFALQKSSGKTVPFKITSNSVLSNKLFIENKMIQDCDDEGLRYCLRKLLWAAKGETR